MYLFSNSGSVIKLYCDHIYVHLIFWTSPWMKTNEHIQLLHSMSYGTQGRRIWDAYSPQTRCYKFKKMDQTSTYSYFWIIYLMVEVSHPFVTCFGAVIHLDIMHFQNHHNIIHTKVLCHETSLIERCPCKLYYWSTCVGSLFECIPPNWTKWILEQGITNIPGLVKEYHLNKKSRHIHHMTCYWHCQS